MANPSHISPAELLNQYVTDLFASEDEALQWIQSEAQRNGMPQISIKPFEGRMLQLLAQTVGAKKIVEIGTLAGYSGTWLARALPADGKLYTLEKSSKHAEIARSGFQRAGVSDKVELIEGSAIESLRKLSDKGPFDFVFIDADKLSYPEYLAWAVENLRVGGMVTAHNAFRNGRITMPENEEDRAMDVFNRAVAREKRLDSTILGVGDGMVMGIKKS
jgi:caffeoyl-CoA O-methyltransferase